MYSLYCERAGLSHEGVLSVPRFKYGVNVDPLSTGHVTQRMRTPKPCDVTCFGLLEVEKHKAVRELERQPARQAGGRRRGSAGIEKCRSLSPDLARR